MITRENQKEVFQNINKEELKQVQEADDNSFVAVELNIFNAGWFTSIQVFDHYDEETESKVTADGSLYLTKQEFLYLYEQSKTKMKVRFKEWDCDVKISKYSVNNQIAITLTHTEDGPIATATVYLEQVLLSKQLIDDKVTFIKTWSENEGIFEALLEAGIIQDLHDQFDVNGFGSIARLVKVLI